MVDFGQIMENKYKNKLEIISDSIAVLGECPLWDSEKKLLYWIDIVNKKIFSINTKNNISSTFHLEVFVGSLALRKNGELIVASEKGLHFFNKDTLSFNSICNPEKNILTNRFNDGKCDPAGRLWVGTTSNDEKDKVGSLYCLDKNLKCRRVLSNIIISNGIAWSSDYKTMYYIDSPTRQVKAYDYDIDTGRIKNEKIVIYFDEKEGYPDGMTIDVENKLWIAHWGGFKVGRWDPVSGEMIDKIDIPVRRVSSVTFGGDNLDELFITTAVRGFSEKSESKSNSSAKHDGKLFKIKLKTKGIDTCRFAV